MQLTAHFAQHEFNCHCGVCDPEDAPPVDLALLIVLEAVRAEFAVPVTINSGYRCVAHNRAIGGSKNSQHLYARAADIVLPLTPPRVVHGYLDRQPWADRIGLGLYDTFVHVDTRGRRARWSGN